MSNAKLHSISAIDYDPVDCQYYWWDIEKEDKPYKTGWLSKKRYIYKIYKHTYYF